LYTKVAWVLGLPPVMVVVPSKLMDAVALTAEKRFAGHVTFPVSVKVALAPTVMTSPAPTVQFPAIVTFAAAATWSDPTDMFGCTVSVVMSSK